MPKTNFLIGRGELLTHDIPGPRRRMDKSEVYTLAEAKQRLVPQVKSTIEAFDTLPSSACPNDYAVAKLTLNPSYIARSFFPSALLKDTGLESIGSKTVKITPDSWKRKIEVTEYPTTQIFVAGKRTSFTNLKKWIDELKVNSDEAIDFARVEQFQPYLPEERIVSNLPDNNSYFEVGIHLLADDGRDFIQQHFIKYATSLGITVHNELAFTAGTLWFLPVKGHITEINKLAKFTFVRVIRPVPKLRGIRPMRRAGGAEAQCILPSEGPLSPEIRVAILDGGLPEKHPISPWLRSYRVMDDHADDDPDALDHGLAVSSAFLFGPINTKGEIPRPYSSIDNLRVLDNKTCEEDPLELYRTLGFIEEVLLSRQYQFLNLSLGPDLPIEDTDVHAWTSVIDDLLSDGDTLMTVAVGNNGERDRQSGNARIQVPSDCVNALAVGSSDSTNDSQWKRASYSAMGPGRSPGVMKPDLVAFGGETTEYFHVLSKGEKPVVSPERGTSFAAPYALRSAVGIRSILGSELSQLAIKALLIHASKPLEHPCTEVGWGKLPENLSEVIISPDGVARIVYQGELKPGKYLRAPVPIPDGGLKGTVNLTATFCYATATDPQDSASYTKAGLEISFRPNDAKVKEGSKNADTAGFFDLKKFSTESERRSDMGKWETVLHSTKNMRGSSLKNPVFDIHYNAREAGASIVSHKADKIKYALIITVRAAKHQDLYNEILRAYNQILVPIQPQTSITIRP
ncbi:MULTISPECIES: S8 family peptidase [Serratia]|uniref:S8 family peptidase n=1 Tax=Serratia TaxID=613 RepID=UPI000E3E4C41|nr:MULTISPECIES: S8 family peptidase [Serratia]MBZ0046114.1 S8 family peptidase [Serratia sp. EWG9]MDU1286527.1 S8 family peptidase [Serratia marcescens]MDU1395217.1 S8 family peptidase [Serratia marcescens]RFT82950.1 peptidase S8 and S53, subtilisin, kexin, sedolisin [Serratia marcescens]TFZ86704.1 S8 family peptidase [Serratia marcescens]